MNFLILDLFIVNRKLINFSFQLISRFGDFPGRKINLVNGVCRTNTDTFPAKSTLAEVDLCQVVFQCDRFEWTLFRAFSTSDAGCCTSFTGNISFVFVHATNENSPIFHSFVP